MRPKISKILQPHGSNTKARAALDGVLVAALALLLALELGVAVTVTVAVGVDNFVLELALTLSRGDIICFYLVFVANGGLSERKLTRSRICISPLFVLRSSQLNLTKAENLSIFQLNDPLT
jgi:hypothetical protein